MSTVARGTFEVRLEREPPYDTADGVTIGRVAITKQFAGDLVGTSNAQMLSAMTAVKGSAGYVAIERVTGSLHGKNGSFVLQHSGTMTRGEAELALSVVPDSGAGELAGLTGKMTIEIVEDRHRYVFEYKLDASG